MTPWNRNHFASLLFFSIFLLGGCHSSDNPQTGHSLALPLSYTGKTQPANLDDATITEKQELSDTASRLLNEKNHLGMFDALFPAFDKSDFSTAVANKIIDGSQMMNALTPLPPQSQPLSNTAPCTTPQGSIHYRSYNHSDRYAQVTFDHACIAFDYAVPANVRDAFNSWASGTTIAIGLAVLGLPSRLADPFPMGTGIINGSLLVDRQMGSILPQSLTMDFQPAPGGTSVHYTAAATSSQFSHKTSVFAFNLATLLPCHGGVCMTSPYWSGTTASSGLLSFTPSSTLATPYCADPAGRDPSCTDEDVLNAFLNAPYLAFGETNPPFNGLNVIYDPILGAVNISTKQSLLLCTTGMPSTPSSPFQSGAITISGATGAFDVTYTGCGQVPVISPHI